MGWEKSALILTGSFLFSFAEKNCVISISFRAGAQSHKVVNFNIQAEFNIQENFNVNNKKKNTSWIKYLFCTNLLLVDVSQSVRTETCLVFTTQHFYRSWDLSVVLCLGSVHVSQLCWKSSTFALGYTEATSFQKREVWFWWINVSSSCLTLGKSNGCWTRAICSLFSAAYQQVQIIDKRSPKSWGSSASRRNFTGADEDRHHPLL